MFFEVVRAEVSQNIIYLLTLISGQPRKADILESCDNVKS